MEKTIKYILIVVSLIILNFLLWKISNDCLSNKINDNSNQSVLISLIMRGTFALIIIGIVRWIISLLKFVPKIRKAKLLLGTIITILIFGNTTILNLKNTFSNNLNSKNDRIELCKKIKYANYLAYGTTADKLTFDEYSQIGNLIQLPAISSESYDISYLYTYDGFLPDYRLEVSYKLPKELNISDYNDEKFDYGESQIIEEFENYNLIRYSEYNR